MGVKIAYRFDDHKPTVGSMIAAFRSLEEMRRFVIMQGDYRDMRFWEIKGTIVKDEGGPDGITIRVIGVREIFI